MENKARFGEKAGWLSPIWVQFASAALNGLLAGRMTASIMPDQLARTAAIIADSMFLEWEKHD